MAKISHKVPTTPSMRKLVTNVVEPDILVVIPTVQQEVISVIDVGYRKQNGEARQKQTKGYRNPKGGAANMVGCYDEEEEPVYAFALGDRNEEKIEVTVGGFKLNIITDSGASTNIIDKQTWEWLKKNKVKGELALTSSASRHHWM